MSAPADPPAPDRYLARCPACRADQMPELTPAQTRVTLACCGARCVVAAWAPYGVELELALAYDLRVAAGGARELPAAASPAGQAGARVAAVVAREVAAAVAEERASCAAYARARAERLRRSAAARTASGEHGAAAAFACAAEWVGGLAGDIAYGAHVPTPRPGGA